MQARRIRKPDSEGVARRDRLAAGFVRLRATLTAIFFLLLLVQLFAYNTNASTSPAANTHAAAPTDAKTGEGTPSGTEPLTHPQIAIVAASALVLAWLRIFQRFHRYKGLLFNVFVEWPGWVFGLFTAMLAFVPDYTILPFLGRFFDEIHMPWAREVLGGSALMYVHLGISGVSAYFGPFVLGVLGTIGILHAAPDKPKSEPDTEMNVVFAAIRESLDTLVNGQILDWTSEYSWPNIKLTAKSLIADLVNSGTMSQEEGELARREVDAFKKCDDDLDDRQAKYELLRKIMNNSSFDDIHRCLEHARKVS